MFCICTLGEALGAIDVFFEAVLQKSQALIAAVDQPDAGAATWGEAGLARFVMKMLWCFF